MSDITMLRQLAGEDHRQHCLLSVWSALCGSNPEVSMKRVFGIPWWGLLTWLWAILAFLLFVLFRESFWG